MTVLKHGCDGLKWDIPQVAADGRHPSKEVVENFVRTLVERLRGTVKGEIPLRPAEASARTIVKRDERGWSVQCSSVRVTDGALCCSAGTPLDLGDGQRALPPCVYGITSTGMANTGWKGKRRART